MNESIWLAALVLGLAGGGHCAGMCGGIAGALTRAPGAGRRPFAFTLAYHAGRASSYALAGGVVGALGAAGLALRGSAGAQQATFVFASAMLVLAGIYLAGYAPIAQRLESAGRFVWRRVEPWSRGLLPVTTPLRAVMLGMAWGWLPCGMVYGALLLAMSTASPVSAAATMIAFAIGTAPSLIAAGWLAQTAKQRAIGPQARRIAAAVLIGAGLYGLAMGSDHGFLFLCAQ